MASRLTQSHSHFLTDCTGHQVPQGGQGPHSMQLLPQQHMHRRVNGHFVATYLNEPNLLCMQAAGLVFASSGAAISFAFT